MSRIVFGAVALIATSWMMSAQAADLPYGSRTPYTVNQPLNAYSWAGPYLGGNLGYGWGAVNNNPTRPAGLVGGVQGGYNWQNGPSCSASKATSRPTAPRILSRPGSSRTRGSERCAAGPAMPSTTSCSTAPAVWRSANCAARPSGCRKPTPAPAGPRASAPNSAWRELDRQDRISLCRSRRQPLLPHRNVERLSIRAGARRRELSLLEFNKKNFYRNLPAASRPGFFLCRTVLGLRSDMHPASP